MAAVRAAHAGPQPDAAGVGDRHVHGLAGRAGRRLAEEAAEDHPAAAPSRSAAGRARNLPKVDLEETAAALEKKIGRKPLARRGAQLPDVSGRLPEVRDKRARTGAMWTCCPRRQFYYGMERGEDIAVELEPGKALVDQVPDDRRAASRRHAHGVLRAERPAARSHDPRPQARSEGAARSRRPIPTMPGQIGAPIPGVVSTVAVELEPADQEGRPAAGDGSDEDAEHGLLRRSAGTVKQLLVQPGQHVEAKDLLLVIE